MKIAQAYRTERVRNEEFQRALKSANVDLSQAKTTQAEYDNLQIAFKEQSNKLAGLARENQKTALYKDTVKKQEAVISKLESLLEKLMRERKQKETVERKLHEETRQQRELDSKFITNEEEKLRIKIVKMEQQINDLKDQLARAHEPREESGDVEKVELEVRLQNAEARAEAAQRQLEDQALQHAREVQMLKQ